MNLTTELELPVILPGVSRDDSCVQRLVAGLQDLEGVSRVHIREGSDEALGTLCIHYDPEIVSLQRVREVAASVGIELGDRYGHLFLELGSAVHARKARTGSPPFSRTLTRRPIQAMRSVHVKAS